MLINPGYYSALRFLHGPPNQRLASTQCVHASGATPVLRKRGRADSRLLLRAVGTVWLPQIAPRPCHWDCGLRASDPSMAATGKPSTCRSRWQLGLTCHARQDNCRRPNSRSTASQSRGRPRSVSTAPRAEASRRSARFTLQARAKCRRSACRRSLITELVAAAASAARCSSV